MRPLNVLVACEESQAVTIAFRRRGHFAFSCDIQECSGGHPEWHIHGDALEAIKMKDWDILIAHPPCTYLSRVAIQHMKSPEKAQRRDAAIDFFIRLKNAPIAKIAIENPLPQKYVSNRIGRWRQLIQPYFFGDGEMKGTCLWLKGLTRLNGNPEHKKPKPTGFNGRGNPYYWSGALVSKKDRAKLRSKTFPGIARAMAEQWSPDLGDTWGLNVEKKPEEKVA